LENKKRLQEAELVSQFKATKESLSPMNLIKNGFSKLTEHGPEFGESILKTITGLGVGVLSKKLFIGKSSSIIKKALAPVLEFFVAKTAISNADKVKAYGMSIYNNFFKKNSNHNHTNETINDR